MNRAEQQQLLGEKSALERMLADTPAEDAIDLASLAARLRQVEASLQQALLDPREPARVRLTFKGRPVVGSHGIFAEFGMKAVHGFAECVAAMAASLTAPLAAMGPIPNRDQHQLLITHTAVGSFGFELEEHAGPGQRPLLDEGSALAQALERTQSLLRGTLGSDDELADSAAEADRRAVDKLRAFLQTLVDFEAVCTLQSKDSTVSFSDLGQLRTSIARLSQENLREEAQELHGELQGVLPRARHFEFTLAGTGETIRGRIAPAIVDPGVLNQQLHQPVAIRVMVTRVGNGRPRYLLVVVPVAL